MSATWYFSFVALVPPFALALIVLWVVAREFVAPHARAVAARVRAGVRALQRRRASSAAPRPAPEALRVSRVPAP